jgi:hypothetical protein
VVKLSELEECSPRSGIGKAASLESPEKEEKRRTLAQNREYHGGKLKYTESRKKENVRLRCLSKM